MTFLAGFIVSILAISIFLKINYIASISNWILETSQFVYYSGHPLLDDDQIYDEIKKRFKGVFCSLMIVLIKTALFLTLTIALVGFSSIAVFLLSGKDFPSYGSEQFFTYIFPNYLKEFPFILGSLLPMFLIPLLSRKNAKEKIPYTSIEKLLHYIFLGNKNISQFIFKVELLLNKKKLKEIKPNQNVYISGMARAGTTVLMQYLGQLPEFKSLSYKNLPFLFMPKTWPRLISKKKTEEKERFHQDGIKHSLNSYEALEEPFFRNYLGELYIKKNRIVKHELNQKIFKKYNAFRRLVAAENIYLAKNNNHLLRAQSLHNFDKDCNNKTITIIPFRNPYEQAKSLLKQHKLLSVLQMEDSFTLDYMDFLVHHEFGIHCKIPILTETNIDSVSKIDKNSIEYWLEIWYLFYNQVYTIFNEEENVYFFCYEYFIPDPKRSLLTLFKVFNIPEERIIDINIVNFRAKGSNRNIDENLKYIILYNRLRSIAINNYG